MIGKGPGSPVQWLMTITRAFRRPKQKGHKFKVILAFRVGVLSP